MSLATEELLSALCSVMNEHCVDSATNTPDYILAECVVNFLNAYNEAKVKTDRSDVKGAVNSSTSST